MENIKQYLSNIEHVKLYDLRQFYNDRATEHGHTDGWASYNLRDKSEITRFVVHNTVTRQAFTLADSIKLINEVHHYHQNTHRWAGIGYHAAINSKGAIFWLNGFDVEGIHVADNNHNTFAVVWLGSFKWTIPPAPMLSATGSFYSAVKKHLRRDLELFGHAELNPKSTEYCPSALWESTLKQRILDISTRY